jgi:hypothetical protein
MVIDVEISADQNKRGAVLATLISETTVQHQAIRVLLC